MMVFVLTGINTKKVLFGIVYQIKTGMERIRAIVCLEYEY